MGSVSSPNAATVSRNSPSGSVSDPATDSVSDYFPSIINEALVDIDMDYANGVSDIPNQGTGGSGYDLDTNVGTEANRKLHPTGSCLLFGASGDYASTPDSAANSITGDIDLRFDGAFMIVTGKQQTTTSRK